MKQYVKIEDRQIEFVSCYGTYEDMLGARRETIKFTFNNLTYNEAIETFVNDLTYSIVQITESENEEGNSIETTHEFDKTEYCLACDIVDHRNGIVSVFMGKKTNEELAIEQLEETEQLLYDTMFGA